MTREGKAVFISIPPDAYVPEVEQKFRAAGGRMTAVWLTGPKRAQPAGVSAEDFARFNELLGSAVRRGVPMPEGIRRLAGEFGVGRFQTALATSSRPWRAAFRCGRRSRPRAAAFPALYGWMMEAGAASGSLSTRPARAEPEHPHRRRLPPWHRGGMRVSHPSGLRLLWPAGRVCGGHSAAISGCRAENLRHAFPGLRG